MKRVVRWVFLLPLFARAIAAQDLAGGENVGRVESSPELVLQATSSPAAKLDFNWHLIFPLMRGEGPLTQGNNLRITPGAEITPVSAGITAEAVWTPIAFAELALGGRAGSGWNAEVFGGEIRGIGLNLPGENGAAEHCGRSFDGLLWGLNAGVALQGDLGAVFPGEWNHVIMRTYHEIGYAAYSRARGGEAWFFENDEGENRNGFSYYGYLIIGYRMPLLLDMVALWFEADLPLRGEPSWSRWGGDMIRWTFSAVSNFAVSSRLNVTLAAQFQTRRNFLEPDWRDLHFTARTIDAANPRSLGFHRLAAVVAYRF